MEGCQASLCRSADAKPKIQSGEGGQTYADTAITALIMLSQC